MKKLRRKKADIFSRKKKKDGKKMTKFDGIKQTKRLTKIVKTGKRNGEKSTDKRGKMAEIEKKMDEIK